MLIFLFIIIFCWSIFNVVILFLFNTKFIKSCPKLSNNFFMSIWMEFDTTSRISLNFKRINYWKRKSIFHEFLTKTCTSSNIIPVFGNSLDAIWSSILDIYNHVGCVKFIYIKIKEFIYKLWYRFGIFIFWHIKILNYI